MYFSKKRQEEAQLSDKRREWRISAFESFSVEFKVGTIFKKVGTGCGCDLSIHGMRFASYHRFHANEKIALIIRFSGKFPGAKAISVDARVVRVRRPQSVRRFRVACELLHLSDSTKEIIRQFMWWIYSQREERLADQDAA